MKIQRLSACRTRLACAKPAGYMANTGLRKKNAWQAKYRILRCCFAAPRLKITGKEVTDRMKLTGNIFPEPVFTGSLTELFIKDITEGVDQYDYNCPLVKRTAHKAGMIQKSFIRLISFPEKFKTWIVTKLILLKLSIRSNFIYFCSNLMN